MLVLQFICALHVFLKNFNVFFIMYCVCVFKEHLIKQGNMAQSPVAFLNQEKPDNRLLVIIKNKDIAAHVHEVNDHVNFFLLSLLNAHSGFVQHLVGSFSCSLQVQTQTRL